jgi:2-dehydro-3-deoxygalactonokinase
VILPGTHSKHVRVQDGRVVSFETYMTGELFQVLTQSSVLRHTTGSLDDEPIDETAFAEGVREALDHGLSRSLFQTRSRGVLAGKSHRENRGFLTGLLIGDELATLANDESRSPVLLAADSPLRALYLSASRLLGIGERCQPLPEGALAGLVIDGHAALLARFADLCGDDHNLE